MRGILRFDGHGLGSGRVSSPPRPPKNASKSLASRKSR
jgi:hypothetical protein